MSKEATPTGRNFVETAWNTRFSNDRAGMMQPGDFIPMRVAEFTAWFQAVPVDRADQAAAGLVGTTKVTLLEIIPDRYGRQGGQVVVRSDKDHPDDRRKPVHASLFYNYGTYGRWERH